MLAKTLGALALALALLSISATGCADALGCSDLAAKLEACFPGTTVSNCTDDAAAACTLDKLDATCSNLLTASAECAP